MWPLSPPVSRLTSEHPCLLLVVVQERSDLPLQRPFRSNYAKRSGGTDQTNNLNQVQDITVDQHSGDVMLWIDGSAVSIGNINTGNVASVSASQSADQ